VRVLAERITRPNEDIHTPARYRKAEIYLISAQKRWLQVQLITYWRPAITACRFFNESQAGEWHVKASHEKVIGRNHVEDALARKHGLILIVIDIKVPIWPLNGHDVMDAGIGPNEKAFSPTFDVIRHHAG
jgi:hypothetical protein